MKNLVLTFPRTSSTFFAKQLSSSLGAENLDEVLSIPSLKSARYKHLFEKYGHLPLHEYRKNFLEDLGKTITEYRQERLNEFLRLDKNVVGKIFGHQIMELEIPRLDETFKVFVLRRNLVDALTSLCVADSTKQFFSATQRNDIVVDLNVAKISLETTIPGILYIDKFVNNIKGQCEIVEIDYDDVVKGQEARVYDRPYHEIVKNINEVEQLIFRVSHSLGLKHCEKK